eukprot:Seg306.2 transcript_id=Seg306.2/GoldUCD/mRNA.D3Y31 product="hypothetical protein" protein_id=Seg306.2/GoldUCD/D3Y31
MPWLYHYTTKENLEDIRRSHYINPSTGDGPRKDACYGQGVYLTSLDPSKNKKAVIATNNYQRGSTKRLENGNVDFFIQIDIPAGDRRLRNCSSQNRDVYLYEGDGIDLDEYEWKSGKNTEWDPTWLNIGIGAAVGAAVGLLALGAGLFAAWASTNSKQKDEKKKERQFIP